MAWAVKQPLISTCEKFLLVMLANYADGEGVVYPSVERLSEDLCQDRRTVMKNIRRLIDIGLLEDTGRKIGRTKSISVYRMIGVPESSKYYYTYKVTRPDTGEYYVGARSSPTLPEFDTSYYGSGAWPREMKDAGVFLEKEILERFETWEEAVAAEARFLRSAKQDDGLCRNRQASFRMREVALANMAKPSGSSDINDTASGGSSSIFARKQYHFCTPEPIKEPIREKSYLSAKVVSDGFEEFYEAYPRHVGREAARKAYAKAIKSTTAETILAAAKKYAQQRRGQDPHYTAHPATWLNRGSWADEVESPSHQNGGIRTSIPAPPGFVHAQDPTGRYYLRRNDAEPVSAPPEAQGPRLPIWWESERRKQEIIARRDSVSTDDDFD
jgi:hypothetical protein